MGFLSISLDLSGSTQAKQAIVELTEGHPEDRAEYYSEYLRLLYATERDFYRGLISRPLFRFSDLYLVKMIGDEFWWVYEIDEKRADSLAAVATGLFQTILDLFASDRYLAVHNPEDRRTTGREGLPARQFNLPIKAFVDYIGEVTEVNVARYEYLKDVIAMVEGGPATVYRVDQRFTEFCDRLNLGSPAREGRKVATRTDYIGLEIDRFFRLTRFCRPSLLGVGKNLIERLPCTFAMAPDAPEGAEIKVLDMPSPWRDGDPPNRFRKYAIVEPIPSVTMKGISEDYSIVHIFGAATLGDSIYASPAAVETMMNPTRAFLAEHGFFALRRETLIP